MDLVAQTMAATERSFLVVGPGDCSQPVAMLRRGLTNLTTALHDSRADACRKFRDCDANIKELEAEAKGLPAPVLFDVDATSLGEGAGPLGSACTVKFDGIIFYFPHNGIPNTDPSNPRSNQDLITKFLEKAANLLKPGGQVQVAVKTNEPYTKWNVGGIMSALKNTGFFVVNKTSVDKSIYPGYVHRLTKGEFGALTSVDDSSGAALYLIDRNRQCEGAQESGAANPVLLWVSLYGRVGDSQLSSDVLAALRVIESSGRTAPGYGPAGAVNVLDVRACLPSDRRPDTRQLNRVMYELEREGKVVRGAPRACNMKPTWKLSVGE